MLPTFRYRYLIMHFIWTQNFNSGPLTHTVLRPSNSFFVCAHVFCFFLSNFCLVWRSHFFCFLLWQRHILWQTMMTSLRCDTDSWHKLMFCVDWHRMICEVDWVINIDCFTAWDVPPTYRKPGTKKCVHRYYVSLYFLRVVILTVIPNPHTTQQQQ